MVRSTLFAGATAKNMWRRDVGWRAISRQQLKKQFEAIDKDSRILIASPRPE
jgi:hypothetical protein